MRMRILNVALYPLRKIYRMVRPTQFEMCQKWLKTGGASRNNSNPLVVISGIRGNFSIYNFHAIVSMMMEYDLKGISYCLDLRIMEEEYNMWNAFFVPRGVDLDDIKKYTDVKYLDMTEEGFDIHLDSFNVRDKRERKLMSSIYREFFRLNDRTYRYVEDEYDNVIKGKMVLGVLFRGTDYTRLRPKYHPVQPTLDQIIEECEKRVKAKGYRYIYLATEEKKAVDCFEEHFPECEILVNKRKYYDNFYDDSTTTLTVESFGYGRNNDRELKALEYISSLCLLSRCDELIAGNCGGSRAAIYLNDGKYKDIELFDLGEYE